jgi:hypothetical protein
MKPKTINTYYSTQMISEADARRLKESTNLPRGTGVSITVVSRPLLTPFARKL